jgi:hypothetical protein
LELIGRSWDIPASFLLILDIGNIVLLWLVSKHLFSNRSSLIPPIIYAISPWSIYLVMTHSFYIYLSFLLLLVCYGLLLINANYKFWGIVLTGGAVTLALYSSQILFIVMPLLFASIVIFRVIPFFKIKGLIVFLVILMLPLFFYIYGNRPGFISTFSNEVKIFSDPGLLNMVNSYQGSANQQGFGQLAKLSENRYLFFLEYILLKFTKQFVPSTYFTQQEKLLNFSFSPPIYLGFLIPFALGIYQTLKYSSLRRILFISTLLVIPSVLAKSMVDLNRLFIFMPAVVLVTAFGLILLFERKKKRMIAIFLAITVFLVIFQVLVTISDIQLREKDRFIKYYGQNYEIGKQ